MALGHEAGHGASSSVFQCAVDPVCAADWSGNDCAACALGRSGANCTDRARVHRHDIASLLAEHAGAAAAASLTDLLAVVRRSAQPEALLHLIGQTAHQAAIADHHLAAFNVPFRNVHASFLFFHWHRAHLLAIEQAARAARIVPLNWGMPYWNITAPNAAEVAAALVRRYAPERHINHAWVYYGPSEATLLRASLSDLVGEHLVAIHAKPHEYFRTSGAQPPRTTNLDNPLFLPLHAYLDGLFDRWLLLRRQPDANRATRSRSLSASFLRPDRGAGTRPTVSASYNAAAAAADQSRLHDGSTRRAIAATAQVAHVDSSRAAPLQANGDARYAECMRVVAPSGAASCGVHCAGGAQAQAQLREHAIWDCAQFLPLWGFRHADACQPLSTWGVHYVQHGVPFLARQEQGGPSSAAPIPALTAPAGQLHGTAHGTAGRPTSRGGGLAWSVSQRELGRAHWRQPPGHELHVTLLSASDAATLTLSPTTLMGAASATTPRPAGASPSTGPGATASGMLSEVRNGSPLAAARLRLSFVSPQRRASVLLLPDACPHAPPARAANKNETHTGGEAPGMGTLPESRALQPPLFALGAMPPHLQVPIARSSSGWGGGVVGRGSLATSGGMSDAATTLWRCSSATTGPTSVADPAAAATGRASAISDADGNGRSGSTGSSDRGARQQQLHLVRLMWEVSSTRRTVRLSLDTRLLGMPETPGAAPAAGGGGSTRAGGTAAEKSACHSRGAALLCIAPCAPQTSLGHHHTMALNVSAVGACAHAGASGLELPVQSLESARRS